MIEAIKNKLWDLLSEKHVSLVMIIDLEGRILWHRGREISGNTVAEGNGFCKSIIVKNTMNGEENFRLNEYVTFAGEEISESARRLLLKHVMLLPADEFFLYIDSGDKMTFSEVEMGIFRTLGQLLAEAVRRIKRKGESPGGVIGKSEGMKRVKELMVKYSLEEDCILLLGETGVGKTHLAELIHEYSGRPGRFVVADTTTINENLFESEIYGHKKGAFTGAVADRKGLVAAAEKGTLLFDEISEVPVSFQSKLLRLIDKKKYRVLGESEERCADVRIIAASNRDLGEMIRGKEFREDLYFRLNILSIRIPPLRERLEDIDAIVEEHRRFLKGKETDPGFRAALLQYDWPGNYRELFSVLKRAGILCDSPVSGGDVQRIIEENRNLDETMREQSRIEKVQGRLTAGESFWTAVKDPFLERELNRAEVKRIVDRALACAGGKVVDAISLLNIEPGDYKKFIKFLHKNHLR